MSRVLKERPYASGTLTEAGMHGVIIGGLRHAHSKRWQPKRDALALSSVGRKINKKTGKLAKHHECAGCGDEFPTKDVAVDHTVPVMPVCGHTTYDEAAKRMFVEVGGYQILCTTCHRVKTNLENAERAAYRKDNK